MFNGYLALGGETFDSTRFELVNTGRALAYVAGWNAKIKAAALNVDAPAPTGCIDWLSDCDACPTADTFFSDGAGYLFPETDPAPWYDSAIKDSERFLGVIGLEVTGAEDSTRSAEVTQSIGGGGVVGRLRYAPRTFVVRALAIAVDGCGMEVGLNWLRGQYAGTEDNCTGDYLWVLDCCPACVPDPDAPPVGPCWAETYEELTDGPADCPPDTWWPTTYAELRDGPPNFNTDTSEGGSGWCAWVTVYRDLRRGLPEFSCSIGDCLDPYVRNFRNVRVIDGPTILSRRVMSTVGEIAELEFTIVAADPAEYSPFVDLMELMIEPMMMVEDEPLGEPVMAGGVEFPAAADRKRQPQVLRPAVRREQPDPFARGRTPRLERRRKVMDVPSQWVRHEFSVDPVRRTKMTTFVPRVTLAATDGDVGTVRVGLWRDGELVDGFTVPFIPAGGTVQIDGRSRTTFTEHEGLTRARSGFAAGFDGGVHQWKDHAFSESGFRVSVDQEAGKAAGLVAQVSMSEKGSA